MTGPAIGGFVLQNFGFQATFAASGILSILALLVALLRMRTVHIDCISQAGYSISFKWLWHRPGIAALLAIMFIMVGVASLLSFFPLYGIELGIDIGTVGIIIATIYLGSVLTRAMGGWISDKAGRMPVILIGLFLCAIGIFLISAFSREILLRVAALIFGLGMGSALPACGALLADIAPDQMRGLAMGLYSASFHAGQAIGATALGIIAASMGFASMYLFTAGLICLVTLLVFMLTRGMIKSHC